MPLSQPSRDPRAIGIFLIVAYAAFTILQIALAWRRVTERAFLGPFLVDGPAAVALMSVDTVVLVAVVVGLLGRRQWGRALGIVYFGLHATLLLIAISIWIANPEGAAQAYRAYAGPGNYVVNGRAAVQILVSPSLLVLVLMSAAVVYLWKSKQLFTSDIPTGASS